MRYYILSGLIMLILILGGEWMQPSHESATNDSEHQIRIAPAEVFEGDAVKLKPHLGLMTGAVGIHYHGPKKYISTSYEIWENGKLKTDSRSMSSLLKKPFNGEVSVSLQDADDNKYKVTIVVSSETGYGSSTFTIDKFDPELTGGYGPRTWETTKLVDDEEETAIWGIIAMDTFTTSDSIEEQARKADWAFVLKMKMEDETSVGEK